MVHQPAFAVGVVGDGVCAHERVSVGLARARCSVVQRARRAGDRVEERVQEWDHGRERREFFLTLTDVTDRIPLSVSRPISYSK